MSSKTRTRRTGTTATTGTTRTLRSVPDQPTIATVRTDTEDKLWAALHATPNSTAADLSAAAEIGKSTAQKILVKWAGDGSVTRTPGIADGGRRAADVWAIAETDTTPDAAADGTDSDTATEGAPADDRAAEDTAPADTTQDEPAVPDGVDIPEDATPVEEELTESVDAEPTAAPAPEDAHDSTDTTDDAVPEETEPADAEPASTQTTTPADEATPDEATPTAGGDGKDGKADRLAPGALRGMVEDWLRDHPGEQAGPTKIAKDLGGKSSGAVSNALDKLVEDGVAVKAQDKPRRFALAPAEQVTTAAAAAN
jgi:predicted transcriptional regulator